MVASRSDSGARSVADEPGARVAPRTNMSLTTILIIVLIVMLLGGGGYYWRR